MEEYNREKYIKIRKVYKKYTIRSGEMIVLKDVNLDINYGDKIGILGKNGSGKTTLIKIIGGVISYEGEIVKKMKTSWPIAFGGAFQGSLTGFDNLRFICRLYGVDWREKMEQVKAFADLGKYFYEPVKTYSTGMRARLAFSLSLIIDFDCYLIDEVFAVGDQRFINRCLYELFEVRKDKTYVMVSHNGKFLKTYANRFFVLNNGEITEYPDFESAYKNYMNQ